MCNMKYSADKGKKKVFFVFIMKNTKNRVLLYLKALSAYTYLCTIYSTLQIEIRSPTKMLKSTF